MPTIGPYKITQSNASRKYQSSVRVVKDNVEIARVKLDHGQPLEYIRRHYHEPARHELIRQLQAAGVPENHLAVLLTPGQKDLEKIS